MANRSLLATAKVGRTHGLDGFVRIESLSGEYEHLANLDEAVIRTREGKEIKVTVDGCRVQAETFLMRFEGYSSPEKARFLSGGVMYITRDRAPKLEEGEYYVADLFDLDMILEDGTSVGKVESVSEGAQALLLQVRNKEGKLFLVPKMDQFVGSIDFEKGTITLLMKELSEV